MDAGSAGRMHRACLGRLNSAPRSARQLAAAIPIKSGAGSRRSSRGSGSSRGRSRGFGGGRRGSALASRSSSTAASRGRSTAASGHVAAAAVTVVTMPAMAAAAGRGTGAAAIASAAAAMAAVAAVAGDSGLLTAHEGDADDREENRDSQDQNAIHPRPPTEKVPERKGPKMRNSLPIAVRPSLHPFATAPSKGGIRLCIRRRAEKPSLWHALM